jgi:hypothetical protein
MEESEIEVGMNVRFFIGAIGTTETFQGGGNVTAIEADGYGAKVFSIQEGLLVHALPFANILQIV